MAWPTPSRPAICRPAFRSFRTAARRYRRRPRDARRNSRHRSGATLAFATAGQPQKSFAHNITELVRAGCKVIVDDVGFVDEPASRAALSIRPSPTPSKITAWPTFPPPATPLPLDLQTYANWVTDINDRTLLDLDPSDAVSTRMSITVNGDASSTFNGTILTTVSSAQPRRSGYLFHRSGQRPDRAPRSKRPEPGHKHPHRFRRCPTRKPTT